MTATFVITLIYYSHRINDSELGIGIGAIEATVALGAEDKAVLQAIARRYTSPYRDVIRAKIVLYAAQGLPNDEIAQRLDTPRQVVSKWRKRFFEQGVAGWRNSHGRAGPVSLPPGSSSP